MFFTLYAFKQDALRAIEEKRLTVRADWDVKQFDVPTVRPYFLSPCHTRSASELLRLSSFVAGAPQPLQYDGKCLLTGVRLELRGEFSRHNEPKRGINSQFFGFAWPDVAAVPVDPQTEGVTNA